MNPQDVEKITGAIKGLEARLTELTNLTAFLVAETQDGLGNKAVVLRRLGIGNSQIANICGSTANAISVRLAEAKRRQRKKK
jgi:hypothetical protein